MREAYEKMGEGTIDKMKTILNKMVAAAKLHKYKEYFDYDHEFHNIYLEACENKLLIKLVKGLRMHNLWYKFDYEYYKQDFDFEKDLKPHITLLEEMEKKKVGGKKIEGLMRLQIEHALKNFLKYISEDKKNN